MSIIKLAVCAMCDDIKKKKLKCFQIYVVCGELSILKGREKTEKIHTIITIKTGDVVGGNR